MTIYQFLIRLQQEAMAGNGHKEFCIHGACLNPMSVVIYECPIENKLVIKFSNQEVVKQG